MFACRKSKLSYFQLTELCASEMPCVFINLKILQNDIKYGLRTNL